MLPRVSTGSVDFNTVTDQAPGLDHNLLHSAKASLNEQIVRRAIDECRNLFLVRTTSGASAELRHLGLMPTNRDMGYVSRNFGQAENSLGAKGDIDRGSYLTRPPSDYSVYDKRETPSA
ncbi:MAG: hypothetical protein IPM93_24005 [Candidatus Obscuribacter sp.]|nr:hypothetical protein [Candidatus Obscuribacter sp.]